MNKSNLFVGAIAIIALVLGFIAIVEDEISLGSATHFSGPIDSEEGFTVDDTSVIDGSGNISTASNLTITGESNLDTVVQGGDVTTIISTSTTHGETLTAANICDSAIIKFSILAGGNTDPAGVWNIPTSSDLIADCIPAIGDTKQVVLWNYSTSTYAMTFSQRAIASTLIDILLEATSSDSVVTSIGLDATELMVLDIMNLDGVTTTASFSPLIAQ